MLTIRIVGTRVYDSLLVKQPPKEPAAEAGRAKPLQELVAGTVGQAISFIATRSDHRDYRDGRQMSWSAQYLNLLQLLGAGSRGRGWERHHV